jgi:type IV pilus assembly protein PilW
MNPLSFRRSERGFGLIEVMVSLVVGMILTSGLLRIMSSGKRIYRVDANLSQMLDSGRFATHYLQREVREAGNIGCPDLTAVTPVSDIVGAPAVLLPTNVVGGIDNIAAGNVYNATAGSDVLSISKGSSPYRRLTAAMATPSSVLQIAIDGAGIGANNVVLVSDCSSGDVFFVSGVAAGGGGVSLAHAVGGNSSDNLSKAYGTDATVMSLQFVVFFVKPNPSGVPALWRLDQSGVQAEMVDGVEDMQVRYGEDTDGDGVANRYATAGAVADWSQVVTIRMNLLLVSDDDNIARAAQAYTLDGVTITPNDRRLRRVFTTTAAVRGRTL